MDKNTEEYKLVKRIYRRLSQGIKEYHLLEEDDYVLIGLSGGKDSLALAELLVHLIERSGTNIKLAAAHIIMSNISYKSDSLYLEKFASHLGIPLYIRKTSFDVLPDEIKTPCFLCSWNRRKQLFELAKELGCNKIALGHHMDDILATLLMNMTFQGSFSTMPPLLQMDKFDMKIIRPMCMIAEKDLIAFARLRNYQKQLKNCPYEKETNRKRMGEVLKQLEKISPEARYSLWASMTNINTDLLPSKKKE